MNKLVLLILCLPYTIKTITPQQAKKLEDEFKTVGIYNPGKPDQYDEKKAQEILSQFGKTFASKARDLELAQARSLIKKAEQDCAKTSNELVKKTSTGAQRKAEDSIKKIRQEYESRINTAKKDTSAQLEKFKEQNHALQEKVNKAEQSLDALKKQHYTAEKHAKESSKKQVEQIEKLTKNLGQLKKQNEQLRAQLSQRLKLTPQDTTTSTLAKPLLEAERKAMKDIHPTDDNETGDNNKSETKTTPKKTTQTKKRPTMRLKSTRTSSLTNIL